MNKLSIFNATLSFTILALFIWNLEVEWIFPQNYFVLRSKTLAFITIGLIFLGLAVNIAHVLHQPQEMEV